MVQFSPKSIGKLSRRDAWTSAKTSSSLLLALIEMHRPWFCNSWITAMHSFLNVSKRFFMTSGVSSCLCCSHVRCINRDCLTSLDASKKSANFAVTAFSSKNASWFRLRGKPISNNQNNPLSLICSINLWAGRITIDEKKVDIIFRSINFHSLS